MALQNFTSEFLQTPEGMTELNRILDLFNNNIPGDTDTVRVFSGYGSPESVITAGIGSLYQRFDGASGTTVYIKESGTGATGWIAVAQLGTPVSLANGGTGASLTDPDEDSIYLWDDSVGATVFRTAKNIQIFTADGTFTAPNGITKVYLTMVGGGGGGGAGNLSSGGGGGGAGGTGFNNFSYTVVPASSYTVQIGVGGLGGTANDGEGTIGEDTIFDTGGGALTVAGGNFGRKGSVQTGGALTDSSSDASGGPPEQTVGGFETFGSGKGGDGANAGGGSFGAGGGSLFGIGGSSSGATPGATEYGAGGAGGNPGNPTATNGGDGADGICIVMY